MPGVASTNVMTTNTTLFAIDTGELLLGWRGKRRSDAASAAQFGVASVEPVPNGKTDAVEHEHCGDECP
jgi:hypothetical protein